MSGSTAFSASYAAARNRPERWRRDDGAVMRRTADAITPAGSARCRRRTVHVRVLSRESRATAPTHRGRHAAHRRARSADTDRRRRDPQPCPTAVGTALSSASSSGIRSGARLEARRETVSFSPRPPSRDRTRRRRRARIFPVSSFAPISAAVRRRHTRAPPTPRSHVARDARTSTLIRRAHSLILHEFPPGGRRPTSPGSLNRSRSTASRSLAAPNRTGSSAGGPFRPRRDRDGRTRGLVLERAVLSAIAATMAGRRAARSRS